MVATARSLFRANRALLALIFVRIPIPTVAVFARLVDVSTSVGNRIDVLRINASKINSYCIVEFVSMTRPCSAVGLDHGLY